MRGTGLTLLFLGAVTAPMFVIAGDWTLTNRITVDSYVTDNLSQREDANAGVVLKVTPRVGLQGESARFTAGVSYAPTFYVAEGDDPPANGINHNLIADLNGTLVRNRLFVDASARAGLVAVNTAARGSASEIGDDSRQTFAYSLSPYTQHRFGNVADLSFRLGYSDVRSDGSASNLNSTEVSASAILNSGNRFTRTPWSLSISRREISYDTRDDTRDSADASLGYRFDNHWRVDTKVGYQKYSLGTSRSDTTGSTYSGTLFWTPSERSSLQVEAGYRYFGSFWRVDGSHKTRRTTFKFNSSREVTNARSLFLRTVTFGDLVQDPSALDPNIADTVFASQVSLLDQDFLNSKVGLDVTVSGVRTRVSGSVNWSRREYEITPGAEDIYGFSLSGNRDISSGYSANAGISWQDVQSDFSGESRFLRLNLGVSKSLGRHTHLGLNVLRQQRTTSGTGSVPYTEHRIGLVLSTRMF